MASIQDAITIVEAWLELPGIVGCSLSHDNSRVLIYTNGNIAEEQSLRLTLPSELHGFPIEIHSLGEEQVF